MLTKHLCLIVVTNAVSEVMSFKAHLVMPFLGVALNLLMIACDIRLCNTSREAESIPYPIVNTE